MNVKKVLGIVETVVTWVLVAFMVVMVLFIILNMSLTRNDRSFMGYKGYTVLTGSMTGVFDEGDLVIAKDISGDQTEINKLKPGDIISFRSTDPSNIQTYNQIVTHKIKDIKERDKYGNIVSFTTYGVATGAEDKIPVLNSDIKGVYKTHVSGMGSFVNWLQTPGGYIIMIGIPFGLLIAVEVFKLIRNILRYRKEKEEEQEEEDNSELAQQKDENSKLQEELERMKRELEEAKASQAAAEENSSEE